MNRPVNCSSNEFASKRVDSRYTPGRTGDWLKTKCKLAQEFVIGGYTASQAREFKDLLLGAYDSSGALCYVGRVGTDFSERTLKDLRERRDSHLKQA
jgi:bifunctional non-homologous end joining protein LigD